MRESYLDYAMSVIVSRALPDVRDGLKPVHRRILYSLYEMGLKSSGATKKSSAIVGYCLGRYHPHGDTSVYYAMVGLAQDFVRRYPLVIGQGNFGCFTGDTEVELCDGRKVSFQDLVAEKKKGKRHWGYSFNHQKGRVEIAEIKNPRITRRDERIVQITLDNGEKIKCTLDHKFMLKNGKYREAQKLNSGDSLMPLYLAPCQDSQNLNLRGYQMVYQPRMHEWEFVHRLADEWNLNNSIYEKSEGRVRHHVDFNKNNNNPDNLRRVSWEDHWKKHSKFVSNRHKNDSEYIEKIARGRRNFWSDPANRKAYSHRRSELNKKMWSNPSYRKLWIEAKKKMWADPSYRDFMANQSRQNIKKLWKRQDFRNLMSALKAEEMKKRWQNEDYRRKIAEQTRNVSNKLWADPDHRNRISEIMSAKFESREIREQLSLRTKELWKDPDYREKFPKDHFSAMGKKAWEVPGFKESQRLKAIKQWQDPEFRKKHAEANRKSWQTRIQSDPGYMKKLGKKAGAALKKNWQDPSYRERVVKSKILGHVYYISQGNKKPTPEIYEQKRRNNGIPRIEKAMDYFDSFSEMVEEAKIYNHRVKEVKILKKREDVYDVTVDPWHNFALAAGVFVHNSIDDDPPAAPRYTEAKLSVLGEDMLMDIEKQTVDFVDNYDGTFQEPSVLPSPLPQLLLNGTVGIAVGMATNILPHNLNEVCDALIYLIDHPEATTEDLFQFIKGPDLPTGGIIYGQGELVSTYSQGKGSVLNRARTEIVEKGKGSQIVITEIPYRVNKAALVSKIAQLAAEDKLKGVKNVRDESDREGLRIVVEVSPQGFPQRILNQLYRYTDLEKKQHINMVALVDGIQPRVLSLVDMLNHYLTHRREVVVRRTKFDLERGLKRQHILEGLMIALTHIDEVIAIIKKSEDRADAAKNLIQKFKLSEAQAEAILEIKLHRLAKLEQVEIQQEMENIAKQINEWRSLLASPKKIEKLIQKELQEINKKHSDQRRTEIVAGEVKQISKKDLIPEQENFIIITQKGYIKRNQPEVYKIQKRGGRGIVGMKTVEGDIVDHFISVSTHDQLLFFTDSGKVYELPAYEIEEGSRVSRGRGLANYLPISSDERVLSVFSQQTGDGQRYLVMATKKGMIKKTEKEEYLKIRKNGLQAISLKKGDWLKAVAETSGQDWIMLVTKKGKAIMFPEKDIRATGRVTAGVKGISIGKDDEVISLAVIPSKGDLKKLTLLTLSEKGYGKRTRLSSYRRQARGGKGIITAKLAPKTGNLIYAKLIEDENQDLIIISTRGNVIRMLVKNISVLSRATSGVKVMKLAANDKIASAVCLSEETQA